MTKGRDRVMPEPIGEKKKKKKKKKRRKMGGCLLGHASVFSGQPYKANRDDCNHWEESNYLHLTLRTTR